MNYDDWKLMTPEEDAEFRNPRRRAEKDPDDARDEETDSRLNVDQMDAMEDEMERAGEAF